MDPTSALKNLRAALIDGAIHDDFSDALEIAQGLEECLASGGFAPPDYTDTVWDFQVRAGYDVLDSMIWEYVRAVRMLIERGAL